MTVERSTAPRDQLTEPNSGTRARDSEHGDYPRRAQIWLAAHFTLFAGLVTGQNKAPSVVRPDVLSYDKETGFEHVTLAPRRSLL